MNEMSVCVSGINVDIVDSSRRTALDIVRDQKTHKALEIARLITGNVIHLNNWHTVMMMCMMIMMCDDIGFNS